MTKRSSIAALAGVLGLSTSAQAHEEHALDAVATSWTWDAWVLAFLLGAGAAYALGLWRLWRRAGVGHGVRRWQAACFAGALVVLALALLSPLDALSDVLFSAHMAQHELLMLLGAPLAVLGVPHRTFVLAVPERWRPGALALLRGPRVLGLWHVLTAPVVALLVQVVVLSIWHVPALFEAALHSEALHTLQHAGFFLAAALFWWALLSGRYGRLGYGAGLLFVFLITLHGGTLGALLTVARATWYPTHAERTTAFGLDALEDQQLAGLLMWIPGGVLLLASGLALALAWLGALEHQVARRRPLAASGDGAGSNLPGSR